MISEDIWKAFVVVPLPGCYKAQRSENAVELKFQRQPVD